MILFRRKLFIFEMSASISNFLVSQDIFGHPISVHYKGSDTYQTRLGSFVTIIAYTLMIVNLLTLTIAFVDHSNQEEKIQATKFDRFFSDPYYMSDYNVTITLMSTESFDDTLGKFKLQVNKSCIPPKTQD